MSKQAAKKATAEAINAAAASSKMTTTPTVEAETKGSDELKPGDTVPTTPAKTGKWDGLPSPEAATRRAEGVGITKRTNAYFVDPKLVTRREGWNPRFDFGEIDQLAKT